MRSRRPRPHFHTGKRSVGFAFGTVLVGCAPLVLLAGCDRSEIHSYRVDREFEGSTASVGEIAEAQPSQAESPGVIWSVPAGWQEVETTSSMRIATFRAANGQEVAVTAFPGDVGGLLANVNRWRGQVGLDPTDEQGVIPHLTRLEGANVIIVDIPGEAVRLVGSIIQVGDGQTWFVKTIGESDMVEPLMEDLAAFSASFHIHDSHEGHDHASHAEETPAPDPAPESNADSVEDAASSDQHPSDWAQPAEWTVEEGASSILMAAYLSESGGRITLTSLMGEGGGVLGNINRWRDQLGLPVMASLDEMEMKDLGNGALLVDLVAPDQSGRMAAGIVPADGHTLFFKLTGSVDAVEAELDRFEAYIDAEGLGKAGTP